jgi:hypothetical protein
LPSEDVVHVLNKVHRSLRAGGIVLDTHPEPENPSVEVRLAGGCTVPIGSIDTSTLIRNIHMARASVGQVIAAGGFHPERQVTFEFLAQYASVDAWLAHRVQQEATGKLGDDVIARARTLLAGSQGVIVVRERSRALRLLRV